MNINNTTPLAIMELVDFSEKYNIPRAVVAAAVFNERKE
jgi:hypothetical protein